MSELTTHQLVEQATIHYYESHTGLIPERMHDHAVKFDALMLEARRRDAAHAALVAAAKLALMMIDDDAEWDGKTYVDDAEKALRAALEAARRE